MKSFALDCRDYKQKQGVHPNNSRRLRSNIRSSVRKPLSSRSTPGTKEKKISIRLEIKTKTIERKDYIIFGRISVELPSILLAF